MFLKPTSWITSTYSASPPKIFSHGDLDSKVTLPGHQLTWRYPSGLIEGINIRMADVISPIISVLALAISAVTAWLTLFRRGTIKMTQPTVIFFGPDSGRANESPQPKVYLRALLFATSKRGRVIESMYVALSRNETRQNFNIWVYGNEKLVRGSGLFVGETGVEANHHFLIPRDGSSFRFTEGRYRLDVFARLLGNRHDTLLFSQILDIPSETAAVLADPEAGLYFDWGPDSSRYLLYVDRRPTLPDPSSVLELLGVAQRHGKSDAELQPSAPEVTDKEIAALKEFKAAAALEKKLFFFCPGVCVGLNRSNSSVVVYIQMLSTYDTELVYVSVVLTNSTGLNVSCKQSEPIEIKRFDLTAKSIEEKISADDISKFEKGTMININGYVKFRDDGQIKMQNFSLNTIPNV